MAQPLTFIRAIAAPLPGANIDTDQILPKQFLTTLERTGLGEGLFYDLRFTPEGERHPDFVLNKPQFAGAGILITGPNFGCGSSREHAPWALKDFGIRCIIAPSFGDILYGNCINNGVLPAVLPEEDVAILMQEAEGGVFEVDVAAQTIIAPSRAAYRFHLGAGNKRKLLLGLDDIDLTVRWLGEIKAFEQRCLDKFE